MVYNGVEIFIIYDFFRKIGEFVFFEFFYKQNYELRFLYDKIVFLQYDEFVGLVFLVLLLYLYLFVKVCILVYFINEKGKSNIKDMKDG